MSGYETTKVWRERQDPEWLRAYRAEEARKWRATHPEKAKEIKARHRENNLEKVREQSKIQQREYRKTERYREAQRKRTARFKAKQLAEREAIAGRPRPDLCELCGSDEFRIVWDHCHARGHFRGWICDRCNRVLGLVRDAPDLLRNMATYLEQNNGETDREVA